MQYGFSSDAVSTRMVICGQACAYAICSFARSRDGTYADVIKIFDELFWNVLKEVGCRAVTGGIRIMSQDRRGR
jgi:hypothetical protein